MENSKYRELLEERRKWYKKIGKVYCSILKEYVIFNSKGFYHLRYSGDRERTVKEQMYKIGLLPLVIPVIKNVEKIEEYRKELSNGKEVEYWILKEVVGSQNTMTKVILRRIGTGNITFYSVMKR